MTPQLPGPAAVSPLLRIGGGSWLRAARRARWLAWASLAWMTLEGAVGVVAGIEANSISVHWRRSGSAAPRCSSATA
jgi:hypothetical protein